MHDNDRIPVIRIETHRYNMTFEPDTMEILGNPRHIEFLWDGGDKVLSAVIAEKHTRYSTRLPVPRKKDALHPTKIAEPCIVRQLAEALGWEPGRCYEAAGGYDEEKKIARFTLSDAQEAGGWENAY